MKRRCAGKLATKSYLDKGITICREWLDYEAFRKWSLSHGYSPGLSIERVNPDGNYDPSNCEWITLSENARRAAAHRLRREQAMRDELKTLRAEVELLRREVLVLRKESA